MPFATSGGARINYTVLGNGDPIVLLHGLFSDGQEWVRRGMVEVIGPGRLCILIDSVGHGESDSLTFVSVTPSRRASKTFSACWMTLASSRLMSSATRWAAGWRVGWRSTRAERCRSLVVGGWDPEGGIRTFLETAFLRSGVPMTFDGLVPIVSVDPDLRANIEHGDEEAFRYAYDVLNDFTSAEQALNEASVPVLFYCGDLDPAHEPTRMASSRIAGSNFVSVPW